MKIKPEEMHYYGVIAGISEKIRLVEQINRMTKSDPQRKVSVGQCVLAMMLNGMGLTMSKPLYLVEDFFRTKPIWLLIGEGIKPEDLNDDTLGRALDEIADYGSTKMFSTIALTAATLYNVDTKFFHGDTSNIQVYGDYEDGGDLITFGYPKQGRSDLKQYILSLITAYDGAIPLFAGAIRGNTSDTKHFNELIKLVEENIKNSTDDHYFVLDSAAYCEENLKTLNNEKRIEALVMILCLCLLVYALAESKLRKTLAAEKRTIPNQIGKPIQNPTMRWIFQMLEGVILLTIETDTRVYQQISNLRMTMQYVLEILGKECMSKYLLQSSA